MSITLAKTITALAYGIPGAFALIAPEAARRVARTFPDSRIMGCILSAAAFGWAAALIYCTPLDFLAKYRFALTAFLVVSIPLSWFWMPLLLAARSLGALWCLLPAPILVAVRFAPGEGRLVTVTLMYVMAVAGMVSTFSPYILRDAFFRFADGSAALRRAVGAILLACGVCAAAV